MIFCMLITWTLAMEDQEVHTEAIQGGKEHTGNHQDISVTCPIYGRVMHRLDNRIFREETRETREANQGQRTQQSGPVCDWHVFTDATHIADILIVVHTHDHRACRPEQQSLK